MPSRALLADVNHPWGTIASILLLHRQGSGAAATSATTVTGSLRRAIRKMAVSSSSSSPSSILSNRPRLLSPSELSISTAILYRRHSSSAIMGSSMCSAHQGQDQERQQLHYGEFAAERSALDYTFHTIPSRERQLMQDEIVRGVLGRVVRECCVDEAEAAGARQGRKSGDELNVDVDEDHDQEWMGCSRIDMTNSRTKPLALFTAGGMGAGKGHTLRYLLRKGIVRLPHNFIWVDPDSIACSIPERSQYLASNPTTASTLLHAEASLIQEILMGVARRKGQERTLVIDGSLTDCAWYGGLMKKFTEANFDLEILFVYAAEETMLERAKKRAEKTGRVTDPDSIRRSRIKSPQCVTNLAHKEHVGRVRLFDNSSATTAPRLAYDSLLDPNWSKGDGQRVDVVAFVEGRARQDDQGQVVILEKPKVLKALDEKIFGGKL